MSKEIEEYAMEIKKIALGFISVVIMTACFDDTQSSKPITLELVNLAEDKHKGCHQNITVTNNSEFKLKLSATLAWDNGDSAMLNYIEINSGDSKKYFGPVWKDNGNGGHIKKCNNIHSSKPALKINTCKIDNVSQGKCMGMIDY